MDTSGNLEINAITLNTIDRTNNSSISSPIYILDKPLYNLRAYKLKNLTIPLTVYNIDSRNNKLLVKEDGNSAVIVTLEPQNYTISQLQTQLKTKLDTISSKVYTITYDTQLSKISISVNNGTFTFLQTNDNCYYELGIRALNIAYSNYVSETQIDLSGLKVISIVCPSFSSNYTQSNYNIIASATVNERLGDIASFTDNSFDYINIRENSVSSLQFILIDERGRRLTINNDWILTILFQTE